MQVDWRKFFDSFLNKVSWLKNVRFIIGTMLIGFCIMTIYRAFFLPRQITKVYAQAGSNVQVKNDSPQKKRFFSLIPFIEAYGQVQENKRPEAGARIGARIEI